MSGTDIFLSYARTDRPAARMFAEAFADEGLSVWWDGSLHSGETFDEVIEKKLREAGAVVVLWSPRSVASRWVRAEATQADRRNKLAPAIIEACDRPIIFELTHAADLSEWTGDITDVHWRTFVDDVRRLVVARDQGSEPQTSRAHPPLERSDHSLATGRPAPRPEKDDAIVGRKHPELPHDLHEDDGHAEVHCLEVEDGQVAQQLFVVDSSGVKIGRTAPADIVLSHKSVSREHCIIGLANDELLVTDLNSTNGTCIDGERIRRATVLPVGSTLEVGQISMKHAILSRADAMGRGNPVGAASLQAGHLALTP